MFSRVPKIILYFLAIGLPFGLIFLSSPFGHNIKMTLMGGVTSSVALVRWPLSEAARIFSYRSTWRENRRLHTEVSELKSRVIELEEIVRESNRFERLSQYKDSRKIDGVTAVVVARDPASWNSSLMINRGRDHGLRPGQAVVNAQGVVGKVAEVAARVSKVILVSDPGFSVAAINRRSRESGLLSGSLSGKCRMLYLPDNADIETGDEIITSPLSADFPPGLLIGQVERVFHIGMDGDLRVEVRPAVDVSVIEEVLVIQ